MAENQEEMHSAMAEAPSSKSNTAQIEGRNTLSWAQVAAMPVSNNRKNTKDAKRNSDKSEPKKCSELVEQQEKIENKGKINYLDSSSNQSQNHFPITHLFNLSSKNKSGVVYQGNDTDSQSNPISSHGKGEVRIGSNSTNSCSHCKRSGHARENCWFLYPYLRPTKKKGGGGAAETKRDDVLRKGEKGPKPNSSELSFDSMKRLDQLEYQLAQLISFLSCKGQNNFSFSKGLGKTLEPKIISTNPEKCDKPIEHNNQNGMNINMPSGAQKGFNDFGSHISQNQIDVNDQKISDNNNPNKYTNLGLKMVNFTKKYDDGKWILDSGATDHMTGNKNLLENYQPINGDNFVTVANGEKMKIKGIGDIDLFSRKINDVLHVENCSCNLLSIGKCTMN